MLSVYANSTVQVLNYIGAPILGRVCTHTRAPSCRLCLAMPHLYLTLASTLRLKYIGTCLRDGETLSWANSELRMRASVEKLYLACILRHPEILCWQRIPIDQVPAAASSGKDIRGAGESALSRVYSDRNNVAETEQFGFVILQAG